MTKSKAMLNFEHQVFGRLKKNAIAANSRLLVMVSGGRDSMALISALLQIRDPKTLVVFHYHHGPGNFPYRDEAVKFLKKTCATKNIRLIVAKAKKNLSSEKMMRERRYLAASRVAKKLGIEFILTAHHRQDVFETQLINLIRGGGVRALGSLREMRSLSKGEQLPLRLFRPLLNLDEKEIFDYVKQRGISYLEDPSNRETDHFRNWLRAWLKQLEEQRAGAKSSFARSLGLLQAQLQELEDKSAEENLGYLENSRVSRQYLLTLSNSQQMRIIARLLWQQGHRDFSLGQVQEIIKRLDDPRKKYDFSIGRLIINVSELWIQIRWI